VKEDSKEKENSQVKVDQKVSKDYEFQDVLYAKDDCKVKDAYSLR